MKRTALYLPLFGLMFFCVTYVHQKGFNSPTPASRLDLLHALLVHGTVKIDAYHKNTPDKAAYESHFYSDKAPGTVVLALVPFTTAAAFLWLIGVAVDSDFGWLFSSWISCAGSIALVTALGGVAMFDYLSRHVPPKWALITTLALLLGSAPLPYATMMFSHALVVGLLSIAIWAIARETDALTVTLSPSEEGGELPSVRVCYRRWFSQNRWDLLAGHACGWALASEYSSALIVGGLFLCLSAECRFSNPRVSSDESRGANSLITTLTRCPRVVPFSLAAIPPLFLVLAYSWACFGDPFTLPYSHQASFPAMKQGFYAIKWPNPETAFNLLFSPARGLLFWTPFFVMAGFGYWRLIQTSRRLFWLTYLVPLLHIIVFSGRTWDWPAGPAWGPRLLSPMIPLLALPCACGLKCFRELGVPLAVYSILVTTLATLTDACPAYPTHLNPLFDLNIPLFLKGGFSPNLGMVLGLSPYASVALYYAILLGGICWLWRRLPATEAPNGETAPAAGAS